MIIIGIDPGTQVTGYGIIKKEGANSHALDFGCIKPPASLKLSDRYLIIFNAIEELLEKHTPEALAIETQYVQKNVQSALKLGMARGIALVTAKRRGISVFEYAPTKVKNAVVGNGRASKHQVQGMVQLLLRLINPISSEDAADALALAICHAQSLSHGGFSAYEV